MQIEIPRASMLLCAQTIQRSSTDAEACMAADAVLTYLTLTEPKAAPAPVTPRAGQVWQKLNVGTKTASKAPRAKVDWASDNMVGLHAPDLAGRHGFDRYGWKTMRITTLQRDWHCLNPEVS